MDCRKYVVVICGPADVTKEVGIASAVVDEWNRANSDTRKIMVQCKHWRYDAAPDLSARPQEVINQQIIDSADILVAILWSRMGTATGLFASGTEEEIQRGRAQGKRVMVYFSDRDPPPPTTTYEQLLKLEAFRTKLLSHGLCFRFASHDQFRSQFFQHLSSAIDSFVDKTSRPKRTRTRTSARNQTIHGNNNVQIDHLEGDVHIHHRSKARSNTPTERRPGSITPKEATQIHSWVTELAEGEVKMTIGAAKKKWWAMLDAHFSVPKYDDLRSDQMTAIQDWCTLQRNLQAAGLETKAPDEWKRRKIVSIKANMTAMNKDKECYYREITLRLGLRPPLSSLKKLTKVDLKRVAALVRYDRKGQ